LIQKLHKTIFEHPPYTPEPVTYPYRTNKNKSGPSSIQDPKDSFIYTKGRIMEALTTDERIAEHDIRVTVTESSVVVKGEVFTTEQKSAVDEVIQKLEPGLDLKNLVNVRILMPPEGSEAIS